MRHRRDDRPTVVLEPDEATVEQVVHARREEQTVFAIKALLVGCVSPRLAMTRPEVFRLVHSGDSTSAFNLHHPLVEQPLPSPSENDREAVRVRQGCVSLHALQFMLLPCHQPHGRGARRRVSMRTSRMRARASAPSRSAVLSG